MRCGAARSIFSISAGDRCRASRIGRSMTTTTYDPQEVAKHWNEATARFAGRNAGLFWWEAGPEIHNRINLKISGRTDCDYTTYTLNKHFAGRVPLGRCLSLGCGMGSLERS